jgi:MarR family transcriptional regulator for hemolysin
MVSSSSPLRAGFLAELSVAGRKVRTLFDAAIRTRGLTLARARLLLHISRNSAVNQSELAAVLDLEQPTLVRLLDGLEERGLIRRCAVDGDRRAKQVALTDKARAEVVELERISGLMQHAVLRDIAEEDLEVASRVLGSLIRSIEGQSAATLLDAGSDEAGASDNVGR